MSNEYFLSGDRLNPFIARLLDTGKAKVDSKDNDGRTPVSWAAEKGHAAVIKLLLETGKVEVDSKENLHRLWTSSILPSSYR